MTIKTLLMTSAASLSLMAGVAQAQTVTDEPVMDGQIIVEQDDPTVSVTVPEPTVTVDRAQPEVTVEQPQPEITVTQQAPNVKVQQRAPIITVEQAQPVVTVRIPEPIVTIRMPEPDVAVSQGEPSVAVEQPEPVVRFVRPEPKIVVEESQPQIEVVAAEPEVRMSDAGEPIVKIDQAEADVNLQTSGEAVVDVETADAEVNIDPADEAQVNVQQSDAEILIEDPLQDGTLEKGTMQKTEEAAAVDREVTEPDLEERTGVMMADTPAVQGYRIIEVDELTTEELTGARVYDQNDKWVGEVSELLIEGDQVTDAVVDVGGFLGLGEKPVLVGLDNLSFQQGEDTVGEVRVFTIMTEEELKSLPAYE
ncbi:PRC-barrel domain-containing protein [Oceaniglobus ichthyenteri]|uniref:PRC-barrel domain-containing protein n=1 Tax=Oceaniglobus ichthyenteri TaxID=2136177 RepID=UPI000D3D23A9|nr:PRC-barrel domain-containing protein [Oceaniglobus ichthyenteri]